MRPSQWFPRRRPLACLLAVISLTAVVAAVQVPSAGAATSSSWNIITSPNVAAPASTLLMGSTCANAWNCWAVGGEFSSLGDNAQPSLLIDHWNGAAWSITPAAAPAGSAASLMWGVTCVGSSDCWAVGAAVQPKQKGPNILAEHWNGSTWTASPMPTISGYLFSVTCATSSDCWAAGSNLSKGDNNGPLHGIIEHWNGSAWTTAATQPSGQAFDQFSSVSCSGSSDCWAVGYAGPNQLQNNFIPGVAPTVVDGRSFIEHWNGSAWTVSSAPEVAGSAGSYLSGVTCTASTTCWAVGSTLDAKGNPATTLVDHWNGSDWTTTPSANPVVPNALLTSVTCTSTSNCWATGADNVSSGQDQSGGPAPFIEKWTGSAWSVDPSPNVTAFGYLSGMACVNGSGCFATGFAATSLDNNTTFQSLIEQMTVPAAGNQGLWMSGSDGGVFSFGTAGFFGSLGALHLNAPIAGMAATPDGGGYWMVGADGGVFSFGNAHFFGSMGGLPLSKPVVAVAATPDGDGYWMVGSDGGVFSFGDATFAGSLGALHLNAPIVGMAATPDGGGYWLVASDGGVFSFGDATFAGSLGALHLNAPIVGMAATPDGGGYWLVASDGGVFTFGDADYVGSVPGQGITQHAPVTGIAATADGRGYWLVGQDGAVYSYGDASFLGSLIGNPLSAPITGVSAAS